MDTCDNFRGKHRPYHKGCVEPPTLHNSFFVGHARAQLPPATRDAIKAVIKQLGSIQSAKGGKGFL